MEQASLELLEWVEVTPDGLRLSLRREIYPDEVVFRTCYLFTDRCYLFISPGKVQGTLTVDFRRKQGAPEIQTLVGEFGNELISQRLRIELARETRSLRELIVAQAFAEADLDGAS